jgi:hypothetical protein
MTEFPVDRISLCRDYIQGPDQLREYNMPPIERFSDRFQGTCISPEKYMAVVDEWNRLEGKTLKGLLQLSLVTDCLFASDILSKFRQIARKDLKLDPMRFYTLASFAWESALRFTETTLELQTSLEAHLIIENAIRGIVTPNSFLSTLLLITHEDIKKKQCPEVSVSFDFQVFVNTGFTVSLRFELSYN